MAAKRTVIEVSRRGRDGDYTGAADVAALQSNVAVLQATRPVETILPVEVATLQSRMNSSALNGNALRMLPGNYPVSTQIDVPSNLTLYAYGASIRNDLADPIAAVLIAGKSGVEINGLTVDGNAAGYASATEHRHGIHIHNSHHVLLDTVRCYGAKGDGIAVGYVFNLVETTLASTQVTMRNVLCDGNQRQGMSIWSVDGLYVSDSYFVGTTGLSPGSGVDIEANNDTDVCRNIHFTRCAFRDNDGTTVHSAGGITISMREDATWEAQHGFTFTQCEVRGTVIGHGVYALYARDVAFIDCDVYENAQHGFLLDSVEGFTIRGGHVRKNGIGSDGEGVLMQGNCKRVIIDSDINANRQHGITTQVGAVLSNVKVGGFIWGNGTILPNARNGMYFQSGTFNDWLIHGATIGEQGETMHNCNVFFEAGGTYSRVRFIDNDLSQHAGPVAVNTAPAGVTFTNNAGYP